MEVLEAVENGHQALILVLQELVELETHLLLQLH